MSELRKAAEVALKALVSSTGELRIHLASPTDAQLEKNYAAIEILRQALAQPEQTPVAWYYKDQNQVWQIAFVEPIRFENKPLYTAPPKREWVGLTDEEGAEIWGDAHDIDWNRIVTPKEIIKRIEAKLREKNGG